MTTVVIVSEDSGETWTTTETLGADPIELLRSNETGPFFFLVDSITPIGRSADGAAIDWFAAPLPAKTPSGIAYDFRPDELYVQYTTGEVFGLKRASQVDAGQANEATANAVGAGSDAAESGVKQDGISYWVRYPDGTAPNGTRAIVAVKKGRPA